MISIEKNVVSTGSDPLMPWIFLDSSTDIITFKAPQVIDSTDFGFGIEYSTHSQVYHTHKATISVKK